MQTRGRGRPAAFALALVALVAGVGPVTFYLAGNVVNGNCRPDPGDLWSVASVFVVAQVGP